MNEIDSKKTLRIILKVDVKCENEKCAFTLICFKWILNNFLIFFEKFKFLILLNITVRYDIKCWVHWIIRLFLFQFLNFWNILFISPKKFIIYYN